MLLRLNCRTHGKPLPPRCINKAVATHKTSQVLTQALALKAATAVVTAAAMATATTKKFKTWTLRK